MTKKLTDKGLCPHCGLLIKRIDKGDASKSFYAVKSMTIDRIGTVASTCNKCNKPIVMPVRQVKTKTKLAVVRKVHVRSKD